MNDYHSADKSTYIERWLSRGLSMAANTFPVVVLTGARQVGKSTFLKKNFANKGWEYISLDDFDALNTAQNNPKELLSIGRQVILDEVQKSPRLLSAIKQAVDNNTDRKRFILSGSANLLLMHKVSESLAGRAVYHIMSPFAFGERKKHPPSKLLNNLFSGRSPAIRKKRPSTSLEKIIFEGGFPPLLRYRNTTAALGWFEGYTATFIERDLRNLAQIENLPDFRRLMTMLALRSGQVLNQTELSRDAGLPQATAHRYINLLETAFLIDKLPSYGVNRTKRLVKSPKTYWLDSGLAAFLMGHYDPGQLKKTREWGALFETLIFSQLKIWASLQTPSPRLYYWRTVSGQEVDFVVEKGQSLIAIEVKASSTVNYSDADNLRIFLQEHKNTAAGLVIYSGESIKKLGENIWAVPWELVV